MVFHTPPAPQGLTAFYNGNSGMATVSWLPASGNVTGYLVTRTDWWGNKTTFSLSSGSTSFQDDVSTLPDAYSEGYGPTLLLTYQVTALYAGGNSSVRSAQLVPNNLWFQISLVSDHQGAAYLAVSALPSGTTALRLTREDVDFENNYGTVPTGYGKFDLNTTNTILISSSTNGFYPIPAAWLTAVADPYGYSNYILWVQTVNADGGATSIAKELGEIDGTDPIRVRLIPPFYDGRVQLKQNLIFQLRAAGMSASFQYHSNFNGFYYLAYTSSTNYAHAGFYDDQTLNLIRPFSDNCLYRNFVFTLGDVGSNGNLATGANLNQNFASLDAPVKYQFPGDPSSQPALLSTNSTRWLLYDAAGDLGDFGDYNVVNIGLVTPDLDRDTYSDTYSMSGGYRNWFGLPYLSVNLVYPTTYDGSGNPVGLTTNVLSAGDTLSLSINATWSIASDNNSDIYPETAQPQFQPVEYDFWYPYAFWALIVTDVDC